jgi:hypothetical protein
MTREIHAKQVWLEEAGPVNLWHGGFSQLACPAAVYCVINLLVGVWCCIG